MSCRCEWIVSGGRVVRLSSDDWLDVPAEEAALCGLAANPAAPDAVLLELLRTWPEAVPAAFRRRALPAPVVAAMVAHPSVRVRAALAANPLVDPADRLRLAGDPADEVVRRLLADREFPAPDRLLWIGLDRLLGQFRRGLMNEEELAGEVLDEVSRDRRVIGAAQRHPDPAVRAGAARHPHLTGEQLARLAADPADEVRAALAVHPGLTEQQRAGLDVAPAEPGCGHYPPDTPGEILLQAFLERPGRSRLPYLPNFPTAGLARFAGDPDPAVRRLATRDPDASPDLIDRLTADPDESVRRAAAACPRLPAARLLALLDDPDLAGAANPALPEPAMWALIIRNPR